MEEFLTFGRLLEIVGLVLGLVYLYFEYHADSRMWMVGIIMPTISFWVYYSAGLYADFAMNFYYFAMGIYGWLAWKYGSFRRFKQNKKSEKLPISHISLTVLGYTLLAFAGVYSLIAYWLVEYTDSNVPWWDAFTTAGSIIATWMLTRKYIEQWWVWLAVDAVCTGLYFYKDRPFYSILYAVYTILAWIGYLKWRRLMKTASV